MITTEDPIEYYHYHKKSIVNQRELGIGRPHASPSRSGGRFVQDPGCDSGRRNARPRNDRGRDSPRPRRVTWSLRRFTPLVLQERSTESSMRSRSTSRQQVRVQLSVASLIAVLSQQLLAQDRTRPGRVACLRIPGGDAGDFQPDPREQDLPNRFGHPDGQEVRHAASG